MKKIILSILCIGALGFTSCQKCQTCSDPDGLLTDTEVCRGDYASNDDYNTAIDAMELVGLDCK